MQINNAMKMLRKRKLKGQSLVETAIFLPVLILLIAGVVEVSHLLVTQNRVSTASRNAARFGAQGGEDVGIRNITLNTVTQTLDLTEGVWDIFVVRATIDEDGNIPTDNFSQQHIYGTGATQAFTSTNTTAAWDALRQEIVDDLSFQGTDPAGLVVVGVLILHDVEAILGLDMIPALLGRNTVRSFSIMRNSALASTVTQSAGCRGVFPLIADIGTRSIDSQADYQALSFTYPSPPPAYNSFSGHSENVELLNGREGYLYKFDVGTAAQNVGLLKWNTNIIALNGGGSIFAESMAWPGNSSDYEDHGDVGQGLDSYAYRGFAAFGDFTDKEMQINDGVARTTEALSAAYSEVEDHIDSERTLRIPLWDYSSGGYDTANGYFTIYGFGIFRIRGYGSNWILLELFRLDNSCGQL